VKIDIKDSKQRIRLWKRRSKYCSKQNNLN